MQTPPSAAVRQGTLDDLPNVLPLIEKIARFHERLDSDRFAPDPEVQQRYQGWIRGMAGEPAHAFFVAEQDGTIVGFVLGEMKDDAHSDTVDHMGFIHVLWVEEGQREQGIGRRLVEAAVKHFRAHGAGQVRLDAAAANDGPQRLFKSLGFRPSMVEMLLKL